MTVKIEKFQRAPFPVDVVKVTDEDLYDIAKWCGGVVIEQDGRRHIKVDVHRPEIERHGQAFPGDFIVYAGKSYRVYMEKAFHANFTPVGQDRPNPTIAISSHHTV